jgi:hypothetical protein
MGSLSERIEEAKKNLGRGAEKGSLLGLVGLGS